MSAFQSAIYTGFVVHHRLRPRQHRLKYSIFYLLLDLDELDALSRQLRFFSYNRFNLVSFYDRDYGQVSAASPRARVEQQLQDAGIECGGAITLLTMPRILGYAFNPLSIYFCHRRDNSLSAIYYEVNNTFGERHSYLIPVEPGAALPLHQQSGKSFYVSPFMPTDMVYDFVVVPPGEDLTVAITGHDSQGPLIQANLAANRQELTDTALVRMLTGYPLLTLKVIAGIHWEALLIWLKGVRLHHRPAPPEQAVTIGRDIKR
jgi:DUF1365 family protein